MASSVNQGCSQGGPGFPYPVDLKVYSLDAIKKAVYAIGAQATASIALEGEQALITVYPRPDCNEEALRHQLRQELVDQDLREIIARETEPLRNLIVAHALSKVPLLNAELEGAPPLD